MEIENYKQLKNNLEKPMLKEAITDTIMKFHVLVVLVL